MKIDTRILRRFAGAAGILGPLTLVLAWAWMPSGHATFVPEPLPRELRDLGVACVALGEVRPPVSELSDADLTAITEILARLASAYGNADFDSFLALRAGDLESAARWRSRDLESLRTIAQNLAIPAEKLQGDWIGVLASFWSAYYDYPPIARFIPEQTRIELHDHGLGGRSLESWKGSFVALRDRVPGAWIQHALTIPHRRDIHRVARDSGPLRWVDLELGFETQEGYGARLVARFVWDGAVREWFLHDAASVYATGDRSQRHLIL